jgi:release factor glutamine methyltransferase
MLFTFRNFASMFVTKNNVGELVQHTKAELTPVYGYEEASAMVRLLFEYYFDLSRTDLVLRADDQLSESDLLKIHAAIKRLKTFEPLQYILGETEFCGLTFKVAPGVLIPRLETEELVHLVVNENTIETTTILDIGTGSGCIALALKSMLPNATITGIDVSAEALEMAKANGEQFQLEVNWKLVDILKEKEPELGMFNTIVSNPPYITETEKNGLDKNVVDHEPHLALFIPDDDPLLFYREIANFGLKYLHENGRLFFEIHEEYATELVALLTRIGYNEIAIKEDISGKDRMLSAHV